MDALTGALLLRRHRMVKKTKVLSAMGAKHIHGINNSGVIVTKSEVR